MCPSDELRYLASTINCSLLFQEHKTKCNEARVVGTWCVKYKAGISFLDGRRTLLDFWKTV